MTAPESLAIAFAVLVIGAAVIAERNEAEQFERYIKQHRCVPTKVERGQLFGLIPGRTTYRCANGREVAR